MNTLSELQRKIAEHKHNDWKEQAHMLLLGGHLIGNKAAQYDSGICYFEDLPTYYKNTYLSYAQDIIDMCVEYIDALRTEAEK